VASGVQDEDRWRGPVIEYLDKNATPASTNQAGAPGTWTHPKGPAARATVEVKVVVTKAEFAAALDEPGAYVIYEGHSRYGQGPAFGPADTGLCPDPKTHPTNPWENYFRMGYDATDTDGVLDILGFSVSPTEFDLLKASTKDFLPPSLHQAATKARDKEARRAKIKPNAWCRESHAWREFDTCEPKMATKVTCRGHTPLKGRHFRDIWRHTKTYVEYVTPVLAGSADLGQTSLKCKLLFLSSCSSYPHFFEPLDRRRKAAKSTCKFYLTQEICSIVSARNFIEQVFKGGDPVGKHGPFLKALNAFDHTGRIGIH
jgi:hypothetical protein